MAQSLQLTQWLEELARGNSADARLTFNRIYKASSAKLFAVVLRIVKDQPIAEEVLQDVYVSIWTHAPSYDRDKSQPMTWMMTIARNRALDFVRRGRIDATPWDDTHDELIRDESQGDNAPLAAAIERSEAAIVRQCIDRLPADYQQAISLAFYEGLTHSEMAAHLKLPMGTIKSHVRRGLQKLKACLGL
jgi:RNA polymerase sigma-70 factor, ECF subfamily